MAIDATAANNRARRPARIMLLPAIAMTIRMPRPVVRPPLLCISKVSAIISTRVCSCVCVENPGVLA